MSDPQYFRIKSEKYEPTLISVTENSDLVVYRHELDCGIPTPTVSLLPWLASRTHAARRTVAIPFLYSRVQRFGLVLACEPKYLETLLRALSFSVECLVHPVHDLLVSATLEGNHLALVVETEVEVECHSDATPAGVQSAGNNGRSIECRRLSVCMHRLSTHARRITKDVQQT
jgi:hypothetical protein